MVYFFNVHLEAMISISASLPLHRNLATPRLECKIECEFEFELKALFLKRNETATE